MLRIISTGSSSAGNNYILDCNEHQLLIEAGIPLKTIRNALGYNVTGIVGCICSHEHKDHFAYAKEYARYGIPVYATRGTLNESLLVDLHGFHAVEYKKQYKSNGYCFMPFKTEHDAVEPCGFLIDCPDGNRVMFATDTHYIRYKFPNVSVFIIECNYEESILQQNIIQGLVHPSVGNRTRESHMSISQCIETLKANDLSKTKAIVLIHLSDLNSKAQSFMHQVEIATGKMVYIATNGMNVTLF